MFFLCVWFKQNNNKNLNETLKKNEVIIKQDLYHIYNFNFNFLQS